jgi:hypothetical protein
MGRRPGFDPGRQGLLVLAHLRNGYTYAPAGHGFVGTVEAQLPLAG